MKKLIVFLSLIVLLAFSTSCGLLEISPNLNEPYAGDWEVTKIVHVTHTGEVDTVYENMGILTLQLDPDNDSESTFNPMLFSSEELRLTMTFPRALYGNLGNNVYWFLDHHDQRLYVKATTFFGTEAYAYTFQGDDVKKQQNEEMVLYAAGKEYVYLKRIAD